MIGRLRGQILEEEPDGTLLIDVGGVGYAVISPIGTVGRLDAADGQVTLLVHTHVREGAIELFGFATHDERTAFRTLIGIPKVGPKLAMNVLGFVTVNELAELVQRGEVARLTKVPGIGKKTAERMVLELEGKLRPSLPAIARAPGRGRAPDQVAVLCDALVRMGFKPAEAERAVSALDPTPDRPLSELIRDALALLSR